MASKLVDLMMRISTHRLKLSTRTCKYYWYRAQHVQCLVLPSLSVILVVFTEGFTISFVTSWHSKHSRHFCSASLSTPGHHTVDLRGYFIFAIPWCPSCTSSKTLFLKMLGIAILSYIWLWSFLSVPTHKTTLH